MTKWQYNWELTVDNWQLKELWRLSQLKLIFFLGGVLEALGALEALEALGRLESLESLESLGITPKFIKFSIFPIFPKSISQH